MSSNPYSQDFEPQLKGFFQVKDGDGLRCLIDASKVTTIAEDDEESTTVFYTSNTSEEDYFECAEKYADVVKKFAKAREA